MGEVSWEKTQSQSVMVVNASCWEGGLLVRHQMITVASMVEQQTFALLIQGLSPIAHSFAAWLAIYREASQPILHSGADIEFPVRSSSYFADVLAELSLWPAACVT